MVGQVNDWFGPQRVYQYTTPQDIEENNKILLTFEICIAFNEIYIVLN